MERSSPPYVCPDYSPKLSNVTGKDIAIRGSGAVRFMNDSFMNMKERHRHVDVCNHPCMAHSQRVQFPCGTLSIVDSMEEATLWHG